MKKWGVNSADAGYAKEFAIAFTFAVTETSTNKREWIAKNGKESIFAILQEIHPEASNLAPLRPTTHWHSIAHDSEYFTSFRKNRSFDCQAQDKTRKRALHLIKHGSELWLIRQQKIIHLC